MPEQDENRRLVGNSARMLLERAGGLARARRIRDAGSTLDRALWNEMAALGWFAMMLPEAEGGSAFEMSDVLDLLDALGAVLAPEPVVPTLACVRALVHAGTPDGHALRKAVASGRAVGLFVPLSGPLSSVHVDAGRLSGDTGTRSDLHLGDTFLVCFEDDGQRVIAALAREHPNISIEAARTVDGGTAGRLRLDRVALSSLPVVARGVAADAALCDALDLERIGHAAMLVGLMDRTLTLTVEYMKTRVQFGAAIGSLQALQHRAATMHVDVASSRAIVREAARAVGHPGQTRAAAAAKAHAANAALRVTREAIQLHGAIGFTDEYDIGLFHRRAMALAAADGGAAAARAAWSEESRNAR